MDAKRQYELSSLWYSLSDIIIEFRAKLEDYAPGLENEWRIVLFGLQELKDKVEKELEIGAAKTLLLPEDQCDPNIRIVDTVHLSWEGQAE
jgi:hypothetical protein